MGMGEGEFWVVGTVKGVDLGIVQVGFDGTQEDYSLFSY